MYQKGKTCYKIATSFSVSCEVRQNVMRVDLNEDIEWYTLYRKYDMSYHKAML